MKIAISGLGSAGTTSTARGVSEKLGLPMSTYTLRDLAQDRGVDFEIIHSQAKKHDPSIDRDLDTKQIEFVNSNADALVASDLACWLDDPRIYQTLGLPKPEFDLKIWLDVSLENRASRFANREGGTAERLEQYDQELVEHYKAVYGIDITDHSGINWVLKTDEYNLEEVIALICERAQTLKANKSA